MAAEAYVCELSQELQKKAESELNEKPEWRQRDIQALRDMVMGHTGLKSCISDDFLLRFLRARKFEYERAFDLVLNYYSVRAKHPEHFRGLTPFSVRHVFEAGVSVVLPHRDAEGRRIVLFRLGKWNPTEYSIWDNLRANYVTFEKIVKEEETQINGLIFIGDFSGVGMSHARHFNKTYAKLTIGMMQDAFPCRLKALHIINEPSILSYFFTFIKPFMKEKLVSRLHFHGSSLESLHKHIDPQFLPSDIGGYLGSIQPMAEMWKDEILACESMFEEEQQYYIEHGKQGGMRECSEEKLDCIMGSYRSVSFD